MRLEQATHQTKMQCFTLYGKLYAVQQPQPSILHTPSVQFLFPIFRMEVHFWLQLTKTADLHIMNREPLHKIRKHLK